MTVAWTERLTGGAIRSATASLSATLTNTTNRSVSGRLVLHAAGLNGKSREHGLGSFTLAPGEQRVIPARVGALPIQSESSISFATLQVELDRQQGIIRLTTDPVHYVFRTGYEQASFFSTDEVSQGIAYKGLSADRMDVRGRLLDEHGAFVDNSALSADAPYEVGLSTLHTITAESLEAASVAQSATEETSKSSGSTSLLGPFDTTVTACSVWYVMYEDSGLGEDVLKGIGWSFVTAHYASAALRDSNGYELWNGRLNADGCTPPITVPKGRTYTLRQITSASEGVVLAKTFHAFRRIGAMNLAHVVDTAFTISLSSPSAITVALGNTQTSSAIQAGALAGMLLHRNTVGNGMGVASSVPWGFSAYRIFTGANCPGWEIPTGCVVPGTPDVYLPSNPIAGTTRFHLKFLMMHEIGHAVQHMAFGTLAGDYDTEDSNPLCKCTHYPASESNQDHCLQSREHIGRGQTEGYGHFFATRMFNTPSQANATFNYYKPFLEAVGQSPLNPPLARDAFNSVRWMETKCPVASGSGVEWDWLTFFTRVTAEIGSDATTPADLFGVYRNACGGTLCNSDNIAWSELLDGAALQFEDSPEKLERFESTGEMHGVDH